MEASAAAAELASGLQQEIAAVHQFGVQTCRESCWEMGWTVGALSKRRRRQGGPALGGPARAGPASVSAEIRHRKPSRSCCPSVRIHGIDLLIACVACIYMPAMQMVDSSRNLMIWHAEGPGSFSWSRRPDEEQDDVLTLSPE